VNIQILETFGGNSLSRLRVTTACSNAEVSGLTTVANWKMVVDGVKTAITAVSAYDNGTYTITHQSLVAGQKIQFVLDDAGYPVYVLDTNYYVGQSVEKTLIA
jgi:hypothetical protein